MKEILVLGGGASGIVAAITAAEADPQAHVLLIEKNPRVGKKLLATGNGRCNLDNATLSPDCFFSSDREGVKRLLDAMEDPLDWFQSHGLLCRADEVGRIYPYSNQASDVLNLLLYWLERSGVDVRCDCAVSDIDRKGAGYVVFADG
ncbi:MAG: NAD(P)/FAD-dependent oxidoreductase, partial [Oscillospiraceae bacterium]|nr:NAD(P)/FAD-dependent oxidoreductase [Oscillospiraceae bacterium]